MNDSIRRQASRLMAIPRLVGGLHRRSQSPGDDDDQPGSRGRDPYDSRARRRGTGTGQFPGSDHNPIRHQQVYRRSRLECSQHRTKRQHLDQQPGDQFGHRSMGSRRSWIGETPINTPSALVVLSFGTRLSSTYCGTSRFPTTVRLRRTGCSTDTARQGIFRFWEGWVADSGDPVVNATTSSESWRESHLAFGRCCWAILRGRSAGRTAASAVVPVPNLTPDDWCVSASLEP